jgi:hypothetical protein
VRRSVERVEGVCQLAVVILHSVTLVHDHVLPVHLQCITQGI